MNIKMFGFVASLIATILLLLGSTQVQAGEYVWTKSDLSTLWDFKIQQITVPLGTSNIADNHYVAVSDESPYVFEGVVYTEPKLLDELYRRCQVSGASGCDQRNWIRSGRSWVHFKAGTPGTFAVYRFYIIPTNSHVFVAEFEMIGAEPAVDILRRYPGDYRDEGVKFAVKKPLPGFAEGKLSLSQACGDESASGLAPLVRVYNNGVRRGDPQYVSVPMGYRFNDGNHQFTSRTDDKFMEELHRVPGWEIAVRDMDTTNRSAGVWCVPSVSKSIVQTTAFSGMAGDGPNVWLQAQSHEVSQISLEGGLMSLPGDYVPVRYFTETYMDQTLTGRFSVDPNAGGFLLTRANGGYIGYGGLETGSLKSLQKAAVIDPAWVAIRTNQETKVVYGLSGGSTGFVKKLNAYNPKTSQYLWQYQLPEQYQGYLARENDIYLAGNYLVAILQYFSPNRDVFKSVLFVVGNLSGATPEVRIFDLAGPNDLVYGFTFDSTSNVGYFANARGRLLNKLDFTTWSLSQELTPFEPNALLAVTSSGEMYATEVRYTPDMQLAPSNGALWKRPLVGGNWVLVGELSRAAVKLSVVNVQNTPHLMVFQRVTDETVAFFNLKTNARVPAFANQIFGGLNWGEGLDVLPLHQ